MYSDVDTLWALISGLVLLVANVGAVVMVEGITRRRRVLTVSARHLSGASGAVLGTVGVATFGSSFLEGIGVALDAEPGPQLWIAICSAILLTTLAMAGLAERSTVVSNLLIGLVVGVLLNPLATSVTDADGVLGTILFGQRGFIDVAGSVFVIAGATGLVGAIIVGPRRGRNGKDGSTRAIPGKSMPVALVGGLLLLLGVVGVFGRTGAPFTSEVVDGAIGLLIGGAVGAAVGMISAALIAGRTELTPVLQGSLAGTVATMGNPFEASVVEIIAISAVGAIIALMATKLIDACKIDDPVGISSFCGAAGIWAVLAAGVTDGQQFLAQLVGVAITLAGAIIVAGLVFSTLRILHLLRIGPDIEVAGLEP